MPQKYQVASEQGCGGFIQNRKIVVGVRGPPSLKQKYSIAQIDPRFRLGGPRTPTTILRFWMKPPQPCSLATWYFCGICPFLTEALRVGSRSLAD